MGSVSLDHQAPSDPGQANSRSNVLLAATSTVRRDEQRVCKTLPHESWNDYDRPMAHAMHQTLAPQIPRIPLLDSEQTQTSARKTRRRRELEQPHRVQHEPLTASTMSQRPLPRSWIVLRLSLSYTTCDAKERQGVWRKGCRELLEVLAALCCRSPHRYGGGGVVGGRR